MSSITHRFIETNGLRMHLAEQGSGPVVVLCHGFPETWYSWRHQLAALAGAGFRAIAPDMRGYGQTERPAAIDAYTLPHLVGDMIGLLDACDAETAVIVGHDWGSNVAWHAALMRPDRFRGVISLSVPFRPRRPWRPSSVMPSTAAARFYQLYFQEPGVAEAELEADVRGALRRIFCSGFGDDAADADLAMVPRDGGVLTRMANPPTLPRWLTEADLDAYAADFTRTGFAGGLNWYRNIDRNWELMAPFAGARISVPALYMYGDRDVVPRFPGADQLIATMPQAVPGLRDRIRIADCSHWTQQEHPDVVNAAMLRFIRGL